MFDEVLALSVCKGFTSGPADATTTLSSLVSVKYGMVYPYGVTRPGCA